jgi:hypothetical protein
MSIAFQITVAEFDRLDPQDGEYQSHEVIERGGTVRPLAFPKVKLSVTRLFDWYAT